jgi:tRNA(Ile)-lysidine synthase
MHPLERQTLDTLCREGLLVAGERVVVGVSGGPDSVGLIHVLARLRDSLSLALVAVYVDHGLRPKESEAEIRLVRELTGHLDTEFRTLGVPVREHARTHRMSLEHAARDLRYAALRGVAADCGSSNIAVAHTADDQAEEILIRLLRGGGRMALSGMRVRREDLLRPFLHLEKYRILTYLKEMGLRFLDDSMNTDLRYLRNRVRHRLLPYLEENFDAGVRRALRKTADCLAEDESLLESLTEDALPKVVTCFPPPAGMPFRIELRRAVLVEMPRALQRRIIEKLLWQMGNRASYAHIRTIIDTARDGRTGSELHLSGGLRLGVQRDYLEFLFPEGRGPWRGRLYPPDEADARVMF